MDLRIFPAFGLSLIMSACTFTQKIKSGSEAFAVKQYAVAAAMLQDEYSGSERPEDQAMRAFMLGQCYEYMRLPDQAAPWYKRAHTHGYGVIALERHADMLRQTERYPEAIAAYQELMATGSDVQRYRGLITLCRQAMEWKQTQEQSAYQVLNTEFNSPASDYSPFVLGPGLLLFSSDRQQSTGNDPYNWTGRRYSDLYTVNLSTGIIQPFDHVLNTENNEGTVAMTSDRSEIYFTRCFQDGQYDGYCKILMCRKRGASWGPAEQLPFIRDGINYGHPVITGNDSVLIFSANDPEGAGGYDLYYSIRTAEGWGNPISLGDRINTIGNERFPTIHQDTLYFSSDHHPGLGGYDIFKTYLDASGQWTPPQNLKAPVNSGWDDFGLVVDTFTLPSGEILETGYFTSSRNAQNSDDIFAYRKVAVKPPVVNDPDSVQTAPKPEPEYHIYLVLRTTEPVFTNPEDPNSTRSGKAILPQTVVDISDGLTMRREQTDNEGMLILELKWGESYTFRAGKKGYLNKSATFSTTGLLRDPGNPVTTHSLEIMLEPIFEDTEIILHDIYYDYDEWFIREDAKPTLDSLAVILKENPALRIQLSSHTDCRGVDAYNEELSQKRAQAAVDYLVSRGIPATNLIAVGYGERSLVVHCECTQCTEEEHQQNRRTTFKILPKQ